MKLFSSHFQKVHFYILAGFIVGFSGLTFWSMINQTPDDWRENNNFAATFFTFTGPLTGAIARTSQHDCLKNSLMLFPYCAAFLAFGILLQMIALPFKWGADCLRIAGWVVGLLGWFGGAVISLLYALS